MVSRYPTLSGNQLPECLKEDSRTLYCKYSDEELHHDVLHDVRVHHGDDATYAHEEHCDVCYPHVLDIGPPHAICGQGHSRGSRMTGSCVFASGDVHYSSFEHHVDDSERYQYVAGGPLVQRIGTPQAGTCNYAVSYVQPFSVHHATLDDDVNREWHCDAHCCPFGYGYGISSNTDEATPLRRPAPLCRLPGRQRQPLRRAATTTATRRHDEGAVTTPHHHHDSDGEQQHDAYDETTMGLRQLVTDSVLFCTGSRRAARGETLCSQSGTLEQHTNSEWQHDASGHCHRHVGSVSTCAGKSNGDGCHDLVYAVPDVSVLSVVHRFVHYLINQLSTSEPNESARDDAPTTDGNSTHELDPPRHAEAAVHDSLLFQVVLTTPATRKLSFTTSPTAEYHYHYQQQKQQQDRHLERREAAVPRLVPPIVRPLRHPWRMAEIASVAVISREGPGPGLHQECELHLELTRGRWPLGPWTRPQAHPRLPTGRALTSRRHFVRFAAVGMTSA